MEFFPFASCVLLCLLHIGSSSESYDEPADDPEYLHMLYRTGQYEEYSKHLQIHDVSLVIPKEASDSSDPMFHKNLDNGDMLYMAWQKEVARQGLNFTAHPTHKWDTHVPYVINPNGFSRNALKTIRNAIKEWNKDFPMIKFRMKRFLERDYVTFLSGDGCYSHIGKVGGKQAISVQTESCTNRPGIVKHEMTHTVGFSHEHERPDRDDYIRILWDNISEDWKAQYAKNSYGDYSILGPYDYYSVMHYGIPAPVTKKPAFEILQKGIDESRVGQRVAQSDIDKKKIKALYSKK